MFDRRTEGRWWDIGLDLVTGCTPVFPGCKNCWSAEKAHRAGHQRNPKIKARYGGLTDAASHWTGEVRPQWQDLDKIGRARKPQTHTFWNDLFHPDVSYDLADGQEKFMDEVLIKIITRPQHFYIICTKRPERALEYFLSRQGDLAAWPEAKEILSRRLMLMTTAENQEMADLRVPILLQIPGVMHGVSVEPGLGVVDLTPYLYPYQVRIGNVCLGLKLNFVVVGGETGPHARPMHPDIPRKLRDDCVAAGVPFFFKRWGEWVTALSLSGEEGPNFWKIKGKRNNSWGTLDLEGNWWPMTTPWNSRQGDNSPEKEYVMYRVGKKAAGRTLDGRTWDEVPKL